MHLFFVLNCHGINQYTGENFACGMQGLVFPVAGSRCIYIENQIGCSIDIHNIKLVLALPTDFTAYRLTVQSDLVRTSSVIFCIIGWISSDQLMNLIKKMVLTPIPYYI